MRVPQDPMPGWTVINIPTLAKRYDVTARQVAYAIQKHFKYRSEGSGSFLELQLADMNAFRLTLRLLRSGLPLAVSASLARQMDETGKDAAVLPGGVRVILETELGRYAEGTGSAENQDVQASSQEGVSEG